MQELRANTEVKVKIGPVVAVANGYVPVTTLDLSTADEAELFKHDAAAVTSIAAATFAAIANADGYYNLTLTTSLTDTEGMLDVCVNDDSLCLPVKHSYMVLSEAAWDSKYVAKDDGFMDVNIKTISDGTGAADNAEKYFDGTGYGEILQRTTIATLASQTSFTLTAGSADNSAYAGCMAIIEDASTAAQKATALISAYTGSTKTVTLAADPAIFTMATTDIVTIIETGIRGLMDRVITGHSVANSAGKMLQLLQADLYVDTSVTPWDLVYMVKGSGGIGVGTELLRQNIKNTAGSNLTSTDTVVGQLVE